MGSFTWFTTHGVLDSPSKDHPTHPKLQTCLLHQMHHCITRAPSLRCLRSQWLVGPRPSPRLPRPGRRHVTRTRALLFLILADGANVRALPPLRLPPTEGPTFAADADEHIRGVKRGLAALLFCCPCRACSGQRRWSVGGFEKGQRTQLGSPDSTRHMYCS